MLTSSYNANVRKEAAEKAQGAPSEKG